MTESYPKRALIASIPVTFGLNFTINPAITMQLVFLHNYHWRQKSDQ